MKEFIKKMLQSESGVSSKRTVGFVVLILEAIVIAICTFLTLPIAPALITLHTTLILTAGSLLGISTIPKIFKKDDKGK